MGLKNIGFLKCASWGEGTTLSFSYYYVVSNTHSFPPPWVQFLKRDLLSVLTSRKKIRTILFFFLHLEKPPNFSFVFLFLIFYVNSRLIIRGGQPFCFKFCLINIQISGQILVYNLVTETNDDLCWYQMINWKKNLLALNKFPLKVAAAGENFEVSNA